MAVVSSHERVVFGVQRQPWQSADDEVTTQRRLSDWAVPRTQVDEKAWISGQAQEAVRTDNGQ